MISSFWLRAFPQVRRNEAERFGFFLLLSLLLNLAQTVGLITSETLFLAHYGPSQLPLSFIVAAVATVVGSLGYALGVNSAKNDRYFIWLLAIQAALVLLGRLGLTWSWPAVEFGLVCLFFLSQCIMTNHYWTFTGDFFDTLSAKRLFPLFVVGASLGGALGGLLLSLVGPLIGAANQLYLWCLFTLAALLLLRRYRRRLRRWGPLELEEADETSLSEMVNAANYLRYSHLGRQLVVSCACMILAAFLGQYLYSSIILQAYPEPEALSSFLSLLVLVTNGLEVVVEMYFTPWLIRSVGVANANQVHSALTCGSFLALCLMPNLATAVLLRATRESLENAVASPIRSLVYNALPARSRGRVRAFLEGLVTYAAMALAGAILWAVGSQSRPAGFFDAPTEPAAFRGAAPPTGGLSATDGDMLPALPPLPDPDRPPLPPAPVVMGGGLPPLAGVEPGLPAAADDLGFAYAAGAKPPPVEFTEVQHDPELDEAVIAFANADFDQCERSLDALTAVHGPRAQHGETWLVRFDLYRATGQQDKFEALALDYAQRFGWSAPQWFSLPRLVADAVAEQRPTNKRSEPGDSVGWVCPEVLDADAVARLRSQTLQMPLPWVFDWSQLSAVDVEGAVQFAELMRHWATQPLDMRWHSGDRLLAALAEQAPTGLRDADPAFWVARLEALRLANRPDQFDEAAIDYCVTYEVSPPSWERAKCKLRISGPGRHTHAPALSQVSGVSTTFFESSLLDEAGVPATTEVKMASVELSGQLVGGIDDTLKRLDAELGDATLINVSCARLIRVDFLAAGDLLNWVLAKRGEGRQVSFGDAHRLVALFFGAMGINEHARVRVRHV